jgi:hypothetical protein
VHAAPEAQARHLASHAGLLQAGAGDDEPARDPVVHPAPGLQQQVQALARELQAPDVDDVAAGLLRLVEQRGVHPVADHLDLEPGVDRPQLGAGVVRHGHDPAVVAHAEGLQQVQRQVVLRALLPRPQPLDDADGGQAGPPRRGHRGERCEEVLDDQVGGLLRRVPADGGGQPEHVAEQAGEP